MKEWAKALNYTGPVFGFDISQEGTKIEANDSTYVEYRLVHDEVRVFYKRWSKIDHTDAPRASGVQIELYHPKDGLKDVTGKSGVTDVAGKTSFLHTGAFHEVAETQLDSFHIA